jgi:hypothetical protein
MLDRIDEVTKSQFVEKEKLKVAKAYNRRVKAKSFQIGDKVWKTMFPLGA